ncbi:CatB-related O-acetyltransferase [Mucilaginibacter sp. OK283]|jgi:acetyltransferase-like isoleucine patch superfamily enzyme|uniref:xenobiotic acyltransferase family protein n=1 Tax=Mucilaginibacter sp. OK283 TaxID=1881049 RepID=UPI0008CB07B7|nr:Acetyltransferase (isoleucine patch superfamily) [Mucilaginibacter sp. OK283]
MKYALKKVLRSWFLYQAFQYFSNCRKYSKRGTKIGFRTRFEKVNLESYIFLEDNVAIKSSSIGSHTYIGINSSVFFATIGKFCSIGRNVEIGLGIHPIDHVSIHPAFYSNDKHFKCFSKEQQFSEEFKSILIGNDVWIGNGARILGGVTIGDGAVIAAGSIVTKDVKSYEVVGGIPAKSIKFRFDDLTAQELQATKWWDNSEEWFETNYKFFNDPATFKRETNFIKNKV